MFPCIAFGLWPLTIQLVYVGITRYIIYPVANESSVVNRLISSFLFLLDCTSGNCNTVLFYMPHPFFFHVLFFKQHYSELKGLGLCLVGCMYIMPPYDTGVSSCAVWCGFFPFWFFRPSNLVLKILQKGQWYSQHLPASCAVVAV